MANWLIEQKIDLRRGEQAPQVWPNALMLCGDNNAHTWRVTVLDGGEAAQVTGSVTGYFVRPDGNTVTVQGSMAGNVASVVLAQACYAQEGDVKAVMRLSTADGAKVTLAAMILPVRNVLTDSIIDPGNVIPSLEDLLAQVAAMEALNENVSAAEAGRIAAEQERVTAEEGREEAEDARSSAESGRASAEQARAAAEAERVANEDERQQQLTNAINAAEADADRAEAAADAAETLIAMPPLFSNTPPTEAPTLNKLWIDTGVSPTMLRRWRGADVPTGREYQQTISADTGSASLSIDNAQGQLRSVALEMGCVATQAGSGDPSLENIRAISGRESVDVRACGKNLLPRQTPQTKSGVTLTVQADGGVHLTGTCTAAEGDPITFSVLMGVTLNGQYTFSMRNAQAIGDHLQMRLLESNNAQVSTVPTNFGASTANATNTFELDNQYVHGWLIRVGGGETYDVTLYPQLEAGDTATAFEPYRSMGGTVTPTEPLYGLPDAKDTVEVSTDGDVTVTRRTGYIASYSDESLPGGWISSHDVYAAGTTPTTGAQVVYELAEPTTETLSPVAPIAPQPGVVNIFTDADTLSATITGSGWDTIGDMGGLEAQLAEKVDAADLATVATSGSYNDLTDKPNIAEEIDVDTTITEGGTNPVTGGAIYTALAGKADAGDIPAGLLQSAFHGTVSLLSTGWTQGDDDWYSQTVTATGVTATAIVYVAFHPDSRSAFLDAGIYCSAQAANQLTFKAASQPESNISVNVHAMEVSA